ncbi:MAG TPA: ribonuclease III [Candidatus Limnocylindrales bacterium]|nr:ribonuclease III [Candidatus Limnocylindrales bacterium]
MSELEKRIGYRFSSPRLLEEAMRHASLAGGSPGEMSYQRLEFLGDSVLNLCVAEEMFRRHPDVGEGVLSKARSAVINNRNLVRVGERIWVPESLRTDPSVREKGGGVTRKMVADAVEAIAGAIFLDGGYEKAKRFVLAHFWEEKRVADLVSGFDAKSRLQEWCQKRRMPLPRYRLLVVSGPAHSHTFTVEAKLADGTGAKGNGATKKEAEMEAAELLLSLVDTEEDAG